MTDIVALDLALQGGGAHGAFTWGVLDRLLDERRLHVEALSGASAGAMNAVVLADGLLAGGRAGAKRALARFWREVSIAAHGPGPLAGSFAALFLRRAQQSNSLAPFWGVAPIWAVWTETFSRAFSPYQWNPLNLNPLLELLDRSVDFQRLRRADNLKLFIAATSVRSGELRIFRNADLSARAIMASACLPQLYQAVEIDGEAYWDGGYLGNPALFPLIAESHPSDLLIIQLNPSMQPNSPRDAAGIGSRLNEITFNASLVQELRSLALLKQALDEEPPEHAFKHALFNQVRQLRLHRIVADEAGLTLGSKSKLNPKWDFLQDLHRYGVQAAETWIERNWSSLGKQSTLDPEPAQMGCLK